MSRYIDSAEALEAIEDVEWAKTRDKILAMRIVKNVPTASVVTHVHAHWEPSQYGDEWWNCSFCKHGTTDTDADSNFRYCPHCGARMEGVM